MDIYFFYTLLLLVAFLYSAVGHGGASGYLALMAIFGMAPEVMKPTALLLNVFVSGIAFIQFYRAGHFKLKIFTPLAAASVPMAFVGGMLQIDAGLYKKILGCLLLLPIARFLFLSKSRNMLLRESNFVVLVILGGLIGLASGLIGIGGGIILSPVLLMLHWSDQKQAAAVSAAFIFVNSISGLAGQLSIGVHFTPGMASYVVVAVAGGIAGAYLGAKKFQQEFLKYILALVLIVAAYKLLFSGA